MSYLQKNVKNDRQGTRRELQGTEDRRKGESAGESERDSDRDGERDSDRDGERVRVREWVDSLNKAQCETGHALPQARASCEAPAQGLGRPRRAGEACQCDSETRR
jgi:hypothetical protein